MMPGGFGLEGIDPEVAAALDPEELAEIQQALLQQMQFEEQVDFSDGDDYDQE
jgi:hypothetical protein